MKVFRTRCQTSLDGLASLDIPGEDRSILEAILTRNVEFMDECLKNGAFDAKALEKFTHTCAPYFGKTIGIAARAQVSHWMNVVAEWKKMLGDDWEHTYAASNTIYVTRQNNILFTVLVQFMGEAAIGNRLLLLETTEFTTTPEKMLDLIGRIVSDRALGQFFFKDYYLMDAELLGGGGRKYIAEEGDLVAGDEARGGGGGKKKKKKGGGGALSLYIYIYIYIYISHTHTPGGGGGQHTRFASGGRAAKPARLASWARGGGGRDLRVRGEGSEGALEEVKQ